MSDQPIKVHKMVSYVPASEELMAEAGQLREAFTRALDRALDPNAPQPPPPVDPGPNPDYHRLLAAAVARDRPPTEVRLLDALLTLHQPKWPGYGTGYRCDGCDFAGYEAEPADWPCETVGVIAGHLGVQLGTTP